MIPRCFRFAQHPDSVLEDRILAGQHQAVESLQISLAGALDQEDLIHQISR